MRKFRSLLAAAALFFLLGGAGQALPYTGTLEIQVGTLQSFLIPGNGNGVSNGSTASLGSANFTTSVTVPISNPTAPATQQFPAFPIVELALTGPAGLTAGSFSSAGGPGGGFGGNAPFAGNVRLGLISPAAPVFLSVPLAPFGSEGATAMVSGNGVTITAFGGGWTTQQVKVVGTFGFFNGVTLATGTGADNRTAGGRGQIVLVAPTFVRTSVSGLENVPLLGTLTLNYVPEPGTLVLLGTGLVALAGSARRRERRQAGAQPRR